jgi:hypothetical protein
MSSNTYTGGFTLAPQNTNPVTGNAIIPNSLPAFSSSGNNNGVIANSVYAIQAYGGFSTTKTFDNITRLPETMIAQYDVTGALEVLIPCSVFNAKIGIVKSAGVVSSGESRDYYDISANMLKHDSLTLSAQDFVQCVSNVNQIISVGTFHTLYSDFNSYVAQYFGFGAGFPMGTEWGFGTLFTGELTFSQTQTNLAGTFQAAEFVALLKDDPNADPTDSNAAAHNALNTNGDTNINYLDNSGAYITNLAGSMIVSGITQLLRYAVDANPFGNRASDSPYLASDTTDNKDFGVTDGFYPNDLFFIPNNGFVITLKLNVDSEAFTHPLNNINLAASYGQGSNFINDVGGASTTTTTGPVDTGSQTATISTSRTITTTLLQRVVHAPLLIRLQETSGVDTP